jgi:hypothetical protein
LYSYVNYNRNLQYPAASTVADALDRLVGDYPRLRPVLFDGDGKLRHAHQLLINDEQIDRNGMSMGLQPEDELTVLTAIAGG